MNKPMILGILSGSYRGLKMLLSGFYYNWGLMYASWGQPHRAMWYFNRAAHLHDKGAQIFYNRGRLFVALGAPERAIIDFDVAIANNPGYRAAYMDRCMMYTLVGRREDALADVERAVSLGANRSSLEQQVEELQARSDI